MNLRSSHTDLNSRDLFLILTTVLTVLTTLDLIVLRFRHQDTNSLQMLYWLIKTNVHTYGADIRSSLQSPLQPSIHPQFSVKRAQGNCQGNCAQFEDSQSYASQSRNIGMKPQDPDGLGDARSRTVYRLPAGSSTDVLQAQASCDADTRYFRRRPPARGWLLSDQLMLRIIRSLG